MISNSSKYAIKALLYLATHSSIDNKIMVKDIAKPINVPKAYIAKLLQQLVRENLISSARGPKGGFYLDEDNLNKTVINIISVIDGEDNLNSCMLSLNECNENKPCPLHYVLSASRNKIIKTLNNKTINELALEVKLGKAFLPL